jgi:hypothetical protein
MRLAAVRRLIIEGEVMLRKKEPLDFGRPPAVQGQMTTRRCKGSKVEEV